MSKCGWTKNSWSLSTVKINCIEHHNKVEPEATIKTELTASDSESSDGQVEGDVNAENDFFRESKNRSNEI